MKLTPEQERRLARSQNLHDEEGNRVKPSDLDKEAAPPKPKTEPVDKQLQALQSTMDAMMQLAKQSDKDRQIVMEAMGKMSASVIPAPIINFKPIMPSDDWKEVESEVTDRDNLGRIKKIRHVRLS
jgi:hypothetical protein